MKTKYYFLATFAAVSLASCSSSEDETSTQSASQSAIALSSAIDGYTRAGTAIQSTQIAENVQVGAYSFITGKFATDKTLTSAQDYGYFNTKYTAGASGVLTAQTAIYYPADGTKVDIYAYAPAGRTVTAPSADISTNDLTFTVKADQSADADYANSDLLWASPRTAVASKTTAEPLTFAHKLSKLTVNLTPAEGQTIVTLEDLKKCKVEILNTLPTITMKLTNGDLGTISGSATAVVTKLETQTSYTVTPVSSSAIIVPQAIAVKDGETEGTTQFIKVTIGVGTASPSIYYYSLTNATAGTVFATGKSYIYNIAVTPTGLKLSSSQITDWTDGQNGTPASGNATTNN